MGVYVGVSVILRSPRSNGILKGVVSWSMPICICAR